MLNFQLLKFDEIRRLGILRKYFYASFMKFWLYFLRIHGIFAKNGNHLSYTAILNLAIQFFFILFISSIR